MNSASLSPFNSPALLTTVPETERGGEHDEAGSSANASRTPFSGPTRMLNAGCYSVSIFGSGADYGWH